MAYGARPGGRRDPYGAPPAGAPQESATSTPAKFGCGGCLLVLVIVIIFVGAIAAGVAALVDGFQSAGDPAETTSAEAWPEIDEIDGVEVGGVEVGEIEIDVPEPVSSRLDEDELALIEIAEWEAWSSTHSSHYIVWLDAPGLDRARVNVYFTLRATDDDGAVHEVTDYAVLREHAAALAVGFLPERIEADIVDVTLEIESTFVYAEEPDYEVWAEDFTVDGGSLRPGLSVTLASEGDSPKGVGRLTTIVRDDDGEIINLGVAYPALPEPDEWLTIETYLWGDHPVTEDDDFEFFVSAD